MRCHSDVRWIKPRAEVFILLLTVINIATAQELEGAAPAPNNPGELPDYELRENPVSAQDVAILERAIALLQDESAWNRNDDRACDDDEVAGKRSLFCALQKASIDALGTYDHRRVALQEVRFAIEDATRGREFEHRMMDFNNLPETRLADIHEVLRVALGRVRNRLAARNGAVTRILRVRSPERVTSGLTMASTNAGGWKTCARGHRFRGAGPCPVCWPGGKKAGAKRTNTPKRKQ